jgi:hypothetical protein
MITKKGECSYMKINEIVRDSLRYPFSDWKKFLVFGIILVISSLNVYYFRSIIPLSLNVVIGISAIFGFIMEFLILGYLFRIVKSSLEDMVKLPEFDSWMGMFINGIKVFLVSIVYFIPVILIILVFMVLLSSDVGTILNIIEFYPSSVVNLIFNMLFYLKSGIWWLISILYMIIVLPILQVAVAHMAYNDSKLGSAFKFREILNKISNIGWKNFIVWYVVIGFIYLLIYIGGKIILKYFGFLIHLYLGIEIQSFLVLLDLLIIIPFIYTYLQRAVALFYKSK